jgi:hypothetical protein
MDPRQMRVQTTRHPKKVYPNLMYRGEADTGGHFAAWEEPQIFNEEIRAAFKSLRN